MCNSRQVISFHEIYPTGMLVRGQSEAAVYVLVWADLEAVLSEKCKIGNS